MRSLLAPLLLCLALAGCSVDTHRPDSPASSSGAPETTAPPEGDGAVFDITLETDGAATIEVPFPTMDSCRAPEHWMDAEPAVDGAVPSLANATGDRTGRVLVLTTRAAHAEWSAQIDLGPACQTLRYDPWSIDPDAEDGALEVHVTSGTVSSVQVVVRHVRDGCGEAVLHEGAPGDGWTALESRSVPVGSCTA